VAGHCGGVGYLQIERRDSTQSRSIGSSLNFWSHQVEEDDGDKPGLAHTLSESHSGQMALRREQQSSWRVITAKNRATGRKVRRSTDITSAALRKEEMAVCLYAIKEERPRNKRVQPLLCCRWINKLLSLSNGSVNTFPWKWTCTQQYKNGVFYVIRTVELNRRQLEQSSSVELYRRGWEEMAIQFSLELEVQLWRKSCKSAAVKTLCVVCLQ
jgi:hypothetical protein